MVTVLNASLLPMGNGESFVTITKSFSGDEVARVVLQNGTLADLAKTLCDPRGPVRCLPRSRLLFYTEEEPTRALDPQLQILGFGSLVIQYWEINVGIFLEAMQKKKLDPSSANFEMTWTAATAPAVSVPQTECMIDQVLSGLPTHADSRKHFVRIFGKLTEMGESWDLLCLRNHPPKDCMTPFKHCLYQHWLEIARDGSTLKISEATPIMLLKRNNLGGVCGAGLIGDSFPSSFDPYLDLQDVLGVADVRPNIEWKDVSYALLSLDWDPTEGVASLQNLLVKRHHAPAEFALFSWQEVSVMVQVRLHLSCLGVARVQGCQRLEVCMQILSDLFAYQLKIVKFQSEIDLETQVNGFKGDSQHRGTLVLVTDLPASADPIIAGPHRMVLCYNAQD